MGETDFELINRVFLSLDKREQAEGTESIDEIERVVLLVWHASGIIDNGGFRHFFFHRLPLRATAEAYSRIGVEKAAKILFRLLDFFPRQIVSENWSDLREVRDELYRRHADQLLQMERDFWNTNDLMEHQLAGWIRVHDDLCVLSR